MGALVVRLLYVAVVLRVLHDHPLQSLPGRQKYSVKRGVAVKSDVF